MKQDLQMYSTDLLDIFLTLTITKIARKVVNTLLCLNFLLFRNFRRDI